MTGSDFATSAAEPLWLDWRLARNQAPGPLRSWLWDRGSLTARLKARCPGGFGVQVLTQAWERPVLDEVKALGMAFGERALVREVYLLCHDTPWVFARTLIPVRSLRGPARRLRFLGDRPLGALLFGRRGVRRDPIQATRLGPEHRLFHRLAVGLPDAPPAVWGRRTRFYIDHRPLLVNEFFLPWISEVAG